MKELYRPTPVGGVFMADKKAYIESGMENEGFYGWGREDAERVNRWKILGYIHKHTQGALYHLTHERGINSQFHSQRQDDIKFSKLLQVLVMSQNELKEEIENWDKNPGKG
ncbi:galactosyltransferase-related protein [Belliella marina]|uniref:Galactosyltransferase-related protein n=1 Tax=Belliella marina TaxID=1644146 RepID=A0ABW4VNH9_9BACT